MHRAIRRCVDEAQQHSAQGLARQQGSAAAEEEKMGSLLSCVRLYGMVDVIRLVHINGFVEEMSKPVRAAEVMRANPQHFVGHACYHGLVRQTAVLPPNAELQLGQIYFLLPNPVCQPNTPDHPTAPPASLRCLSSSRSTRRLELADLPRIPSSSDERPFIAAAAPPTFRIHHCDGVTKLLISKQYLAEFLSGNKDAPDHWDLKGRKSEEEGEEEQEKRKSLHHQRRDEGAGAAKDQYSGADEGCEQKIGNMVGVCAPKRVWSWRPALESIMESP